MFVKVSRNGVDPIQKSAFCTMSYLLLGRLVLVSKCSFDIAVEVEF